MFLGWDIGGVNTKVACVRDGAVVDARASAFELQREPSALVSRLRELAASIVGRTRDRFAQAGIAPIHHAVTMTAELSQMFRTKRDGVAFVLDAVERAFPDDHVHVFSAGGAFLALDDARRQPHAVAAANWVATAQVVAATHQNALLVDIGTTTTDIIPIVGGEIAAVGWSDPDRLASGELVYSGAVRTPVEAILSVVPYGAGTAGVSAEAFALSGDVHVWRGALDPVDYTAPTPDGRPVTRAFCGERLARVICADRELLDDTGVSRIADAAAQVQIGRIAAAIRGVAVRHPQVHLAAVTGVGAFLAADAARMAGLDVVALASELGAAGARCAPAAAVAVLLEAHVRGTVLPLSTRSCDHGHSSERSVDVVVKIGGGLLSAGGDLERAVAAVTRMARTRRVLVVPGGGPFADAVRELDARRGLSADAAHWMAILAMDQYAHLLAATFASARLVSTPRQAQAALADGRVPVLMPSQWLRDADPLPHEWGVTGDSIAAWIAGEVRANELLLVKPRGAAGRVVDDHFDRALPREVTVRVVTADQDIDVF